MNGRRIATLFWSGVLQWSRVGANAVVFLLLSRWLTLEQIGAVAAAQAPVLVLQAVLTATIPDFIVQEEALDQRRQSTMFWASLGIGAGIMLFLCALAPLISAGIDDPEAFYFLLVLSLCPAAWSVAAVFEGLLRKQLNTRALGLRTTIAAVVSGVIAVTASAYGAGAWAIVAFTTLNAFLGAAMTIGMSSWRPSAQFDPAYLRGTIGSLCSLAGRHMLAATTIPMLQYATVLQLGTAAGGALQIGARLFTLVDAVAITPFRFLVMPLIARLRDEALVRESFYKLVAIGSLIAAPAYFGIVVTAPFALPLLLGPANGNPSIILVQLLCLNGPLTILSKVTIQVLAGRGRLRTVFAWQAILSVVAVLPALPMAMLSVEAVVTTYSIGGGIFSMILAGFGAHRLLGASRRRLAAEWIGPFLAGATMLAAIPLATYLAPGQLAVQLAIAGLSAPILFALGLGLFGRAQLRTAIALIKANRKGPAPDTAASEA